MIRTIFRKKLLRCFAVSFMLAVLLKHQLVAAETAEIFSSGQVKILHKFSPDLSVPTTSKANKEVLQIKARKIRRGKVTRVSDGFFEIELQGFKGELKAAKYTLKDSDLIATLIINSFEDEKVKLALELNNKIEVNYRWLVKNNSFSIILEKKQNTLEHNNQKQQIEESPTISPTVSPTVTLTAIPTETFTPTQTPSVTATATATPTASATFTPTFSPTFTPTASPTITPSPSPSLLPIGNEITKILFSDLGEDKKGLVIEHQGCDSASLVKKSESSYELDIFECTAKKAELLLPYFAPKDFNGFLEAQIKESSSEKLTLKIKIEKSTYLSLLNIADSYQVIASKAKK